MTDNTIGIIIEKVGTSGALIIAMYWLLGKHLKDISCALATLNKGIDEIKGHLLWQKTNDKNQQ